MKAYALALEALENAGVAHAVIGTYALRAMFPDEMQDYPIKDCDIVLAPGLANVQAAVDVLAAMGWQVSIWESLVLGPLTEAQLLGKFYLRARLSSLVIDLTHECMIPWPEMAAGKLRVGGFESASVAHILALKRMKGWPTDLEWIEKVESWMRA